MLKRTIAFLWRLYNLGRLTFYNIEHGKRRIIHGRIGLRIRGGVVIIGDNCYISSGLDMNPLCARSNAFLCVEKDAKLTIGDGCAMSSPRIWAHHKISIGNHVMIGGNVIIVDSDCHSLDYQFRKDINVDQQHKCNKPISIEDDVFIGMNVIILKGVTIGARSIIGAGSVVTQSIPSDCIAAGNPAKVIKKV